MTRVFDVEADGFYDTVTTIHCLVSQDPDTLEICISPHDFDLGLGRVLPFEEHRKLLASGKQVGHNVLMYDFGVLEKVLGWKPPPISMVDDTFIQSSLFNPDIPIPKGCNKGAHSLMAWGIRMNYPKGDVDSFDIYTPAMLRYCIRDVEITTKLYRKMQAIRKMHDWELSLKIEYTMARLQAKQERHGVVLDEDKCYDLVEKLMAETAMIDSVILPMVPTKAKQYGVEIREPFKLDGDLKKAVVDWYGQALGRGDG